MKKEVINQEISQVDLWKQEYKRVFKSVVDGKDYIWRRIKRSEYASIMSNSEGETLDERIYNRQVAITTTVVLNYSAEDILVDCEDLAGLATIISEECLDKSGFNAEATVEL